MRESWRRCFLAHSETPEYRRALREAEETIASALARAQKPYVAFSGGKDSTALLHLVLQQQPDVMVLHWDYGRHFMPWPLEREVRRNARLLGARHLRIESSPLYERLGRQAYNIWGKVFLGQVAPALAREGYDLAFVGLRAEESWARRARIRRQRYLSAIPECWPLASWTWLDVWAYIISNKLPYPSYYDQVGELVGYDRARFATLFDPQLQHLGGEALEKVLYWRWRNYGLG